MMEIWPIINTSKLGTSLMDYRPRSSDAAQRKITRYTHYLGKGNKKKIILNFDTFLCLWQQIVKMILDFFLKYNVPS